MRTMLVLALLAVVLFFMAVWQFGNAFEETCSEIDESGGLKAVVERVWYGSKPTDDD